MTKEELDKISEIAIKAIKDVNDDYILIGEATGFVRGIKYFYSKIQEDFGNDL